MQRERSCLNIKAKQRLSARLQLSEAIGSGLAPGGTVIDIPSGDTSLLAIGFLNSYSTHSQHNDLFLTATSYSDPAEATLEPMGRPFPESGSYLSRSGRFLIVHPITAREPYTYHLFDTVSATWTVAGKEDLDRLLALSPRSATALYPEACGSAFSVNGGAAFTWRCLIKPPHPAIDRTSLALRAVAADARIVPFFAGPGEVTFGTYATDGAAHLLFCSDKVRGGNQLHCDEHAFDHSGEFPYAIWQTAGALHVATNWGTVLRYDRRSRSIAIERHSDGKSFQVYAALHYRNGVLLGEYPGGTIFEYTDALRRAAHQLPLDAYRGKTGAETQVLMGYAGRIFAGVWPFGELHVFDPARGAWTLERRLFGGPDVSGKAPFEVETGGNLLGQRIGQMLVVGDSLYIATGSKTGRLLQPSDFPKVPQSALDEYGRIWRYRAPGTLAVDISAAVRAGEAVRVEVRGERLTIAAGGKVLGETTFRRRSAGCGGHPQRNTGFFGPLMGVTASVEIDHNGLTCR